MDFGTLSPEINSTRMYSGPGSGPLLAAASAWRKLSEEVNSLASAYLSVVARLTTDGWRGPSSTMMAQAAMPYVTWLHSTAAQAEQSAIQAQAAASAYQTAHTTIVPPAMITANRIHWLMLVTTNFFGQNSPAIAAAEAQYDAMWAQDTAVMNGYAAASAAASALTPFTTPPATTNPVGAAAAQSAAPLASFTAVDVFNDTVSSLSGAASVSSSSFGGASIGTTNHAIAVNAERDEHQGVGPFLGLGTTPVARPALERPPAVALIGRATIAGSLSVPQAWAATVPAMTGDTAAAVPPARATTASLSSGALPPGMFGESMLGTMAGRGVNSTAAKLRRPSIVPRSPAAG
ncbi:PPE family protein [Mycobacterium sp. M1]|uniref:PPE family protein n=1 Tax=Mycolicibacter acidiphilus TaxID=2835306 RepID=A0ABS5RIT0_9MYCO|nr:PPE family protein [Mycolicibacter acidiphilus]MBS9534195.1 PPE family protein [Mycolicibacter acidiphilus]